MVDGIQDQQLCRNIPVEVDRVEVLATDSRDLDNISQEEARMGYLILRMHKLHPRVDQRLKSWIFIQLSGMLGFSHVSLISAKSIPFLWTTTSKSSNLLDMDRTLERKNLGRVDTRP